MPPIRPTVEGDRQAVLALVRSAVGAGDRDGHEEVAIVVRTWSCGDAVKPIDLIAVEPGTVVGHVLAATGMLDRSEIPALAPLSVLPAYQGRGIGSSLVRQLLRRADRAGWPMVVILGDPNYYSRFGFEPSGPLGVIYPPVGEGNSHFQVRRLSSYEGPYSGRFRYCWEEPSS